MGTWGVGFLDNDTAGDVEAAFERHLEAGLSVAGAVQAVYSEYGELLQDQDTRPEVILALAWLTGARGKVPARVARDALEILESGASLKRWNGAGEYGARREIERQLAGIIQGSVPHPERKNRPARPPKPVVGDIYAIPLPGGEQYVYAHLVFDDPRRGELIQVYNLRSTSTPRLHEIVASGPMFHPVYVSVRAEVEISGWRKIGNVPVSDFKFPVFATQARDFWWVYDGYESKRVQQLPPGFGQPEPPIMWGHETLVRRIETGWLPPGLSV